ncbi:HDOD domain-containing protein [Janthinobacterium fluminis]|uniref:HDOD domain-containing protein n=1 Tax=Janthinobacterium fluminis TaxID=2987524 RepID=A0ABT5K7Q1_9BURK|nr:HDOD domain-containing protein [Janthinobacterium fluminis]MDC8760091.1 HDOD domain-containing protein [Janthinobacterium fluminis]
MPAVAIEDIIKRIHDLPSLPVVVIELLSTMEQEDIDVHLLADKITLDQSLTAKTLRLANSSFYGMQSKVTSIQQAIAVLGFHSIRTLVTACSVTGGIAPLPGNRFDFQCFWRHSVATAVAAKALAPRLRQNAETAFTAGLLHDLGTLVLATRFPAQYEEVASWRRQHDCGSAEAERAVFGLDHAAVGSALAAYWKFPAAIQSAVALHHELREQDVVSLPLTIHVANILAHALDLSGQEDDLVPPLSQRVWRTLALSDEVFLELFRDTELAFQDMSQILVG